MGTPERWNDPSHRSTSGGSWVPAPCVVDDVALVERGAAKRGGAESSGKGYGTVVGPPRNEESWKLWGLPGRRLAMLIFKVVIAGRRAQTRVWQNSGPKLEGGANARTEWRLPLWRGSLYIEFGTRVHRRVPLSRLPKIHRQRIRHHGGPAQDCAPNPRSGQDIQQAR